MSAVYKVVRNLIFQQVGDALASFLPQQSGEQPEKGTLWQLLQPDETICLKLTESFAMYPTAAVSGWYLSHPESRYFGVTNIEKDQLIDYAQRIGIPIGEAERWLAPILDYDPE